MSLCYVKPYLYLEIDTGEICFALFGLRCNFGQTRTMIIVLLIRTCTRGGYKRAINGYLFHGGLLLSSPTKECRLVSFYFLARHPAYDLVSTSVKYAYFCVHPGTLKRSKDSFVFGNNYLCPFGLVMIQGGGVHTSEHRFRGTTLHRNGS